MKKPSTTVEKALKLRKRVKKQKPSFARLEGWRYKRLKKSWRRPRGLDNKARRKIKGWPQTASVGYRGPKVARGLHPSGYEEVIVYNVEQLRQVDPKTQAAKIAHTVGKKKRAGIIVEARKKKIKILNFKQIKEPEKEKEPEEEIEKKEAPKEKKAEEAVEETVSEKPKPKPRPRKKHKKSEEQ